MSLIGEQKALTKADQVFGSQVVNVLFSFFAPAELAPQQRTSKIFRGKIQGVVLDKSFNRLFMQLHDFAVQKEIAGKPNMKPALLGFGNPKQVSCFPNQEEIKQIAEAKGQPLERCRNLGRRLEQPLLHYLEAIDLGKISIDHLHPEALDALLKFSKSSLRVFFSDNKIYEKLIEIKNKLTRLLIEAAMNNKEEHVLILLQRGADVNGFIVTWAYGAKFSQLSVITALIVASMNDYPGVVKILLAHGANINFTTKGGMGETHTALTLAHQYKARQVIGLLLQQIHPHRFIKMSAPHSDEPELNPLMLAAIYNHEDVARSLVEQKVDVHLKVPPRKNLVGSILTWGGRSSLAFACINGSAGIVKLLLSQKADIRERVKYTYISSEEHEMTLPMIAVINKHAKVLITLAESKADIGARSSYGWTALHYAAAEAPLEVVKQLVDAGGNCDDLVRRAASRNCNEKVLDYIEGQLREKSEKGFKAEDGLEFLPVTTRPNLS